MKHKASERGVIKAGERLSKALVIARQSKEACCRGKNAFDHPSTRQQDKATFCLVVLDHFQLDAMRLCRLLCVLTGVSLIHIGRLYAIACNLLDRQRQLLNPPTRSNRGANEQLIPVLWQRYLLAGGVTLLEVLPVDTASIARRIAGDHDQPFAFRQHERHHAVGIG